MPNYKYELGQKVDCRKGPRPDSELCCCNATIVGRYMLKSISAYHIRYSENGCDKYWDVVESLLFPAASQSIIAACTCNIRDLMVQGCKCGHLVKE